MHPHYLQLMDMVSSLFDRYLFALKVHRSLEHIHSLIDHPEFIFGVGVYATISNCVLGVVLLCKSKSIEGEDN